MGTLSDSDQQALLRLFESFDENDIEFTLLRKYERLPGDVPSDVDILVEPTDFERAVELSEAVGFRRETDEAESNPLLPDVVQNPTEAGGRAIRALEAAVQALPMVESSESVDTRICHRQYGPIKLDMVNHLRFPERGGTPVPSRVEELLLHRRERYREWYVPSPPDELAHVIAHCLADYDRTFPAYYADKYDDLRETVLSDQLYRIQFKELLVYLFGEDASDVFDTVATDEYSSITESLALDRNSEPRASRRR